MEQKKRVIALGFFDGVHNGHGALMRRTAQVAQELGAVPSAFTFDPHPQTVIL
ncbi:MAG TPA: riboflavin biosynthesis protein RibF, partial [Candidatus Evtepia faecavium]|nr:riboflavin biosynthesis protein RibF [Candidatus Evtepia faecavium]